MARAKTREQSGTARNGAAPQTSSVVAATDVARRAYHLNVARACGHNLENWLRAEPKRTSRRVQASAAMLQKALLEGIRAEFLEMPGLQLTVEQVGRLVAFDGQCVKRFSIRWVDAKFLCRRSNGVYARVTEGDISRRRSTGGPMVE
jgi:hypothetical protein